MVYPMTDKSPKEIGYAEMTEHVTKIASSDFKCFSM